MLIQFHLANALLCLLLAAHFLFTGAMRPTPKRLLGLNFALYAHQSIALVAILNGHGLGFSLLRPAVAMLIGPALYVYFSCVRRPDSQLRRKDGLHLVLGLLIFAGLCFIRPLRQFIDVAIVASFVSYFFLIALQMRHGHQSLTHLGAHANAAFRWLSSLMLMTFISIALEIAIVFELKQGVALRDSWSLLIAAGAFLLINTATIWAALVRSDWLEWMIAFGDQALHRPAASIDSGVAAALFQRWENLVKTDSLHKLEFGITLSQAAKKLQVPARQLSNAINQHYGTSYSVYLNDQRIAEAQRLLLADPGSNITEVMHASGFNSKSNFNKEFLRVTGTSPSGYRAGRLDETSVGAKL
jgi:AraC-like DNA-binding protein